MELISCWLLIVELAACWFLFVKRTKVLLVKPILFMELFPFWFLFVELVASLFFSSLYFYFNLSGCETDFVFETRCLRIFCWQNLLHDCFFLETCDIMIFLFLKLLYWFFSLWNWFCLWNWLRAEFCSGNTMRADFCSWNLLHVLFSFILNKFFLKLIVSR